MQHPYSAIIHRLAPFGSRHDIPSRHYIFPQILQIPVELGCYIVLLVTMKVYYTHLSRQGNIVALISVILMQCFHHLAQHAFVVFPLFDLRRHILWQHNVVTFFNRMEALGVENKVHTKVLCSKQRKPQEQTRNRTYVTA